CAFLRIAWIGGARAASERNLVVEILAEVFARAFARALGAGARGEAAFVIVRATAAVAAAAQHGELAAILLQHDFGRVLLDPVLLVLAGLQLALDVHGRALLQILLGDLREVLVEDDHAVPLGLFFALARLLVAPGFRGGDREVHHRIA